jgi:hypothetical protein
MSPRVIGRSVSLRSLARTLACLVAIASLFLFAASVGAAGPAPTGSITTGPVTGATIVPPGYSYGYGYGYGAGYYPYAPGYISPSYVPPGVTGGISCGGLYGCPLNLPYFGYGTTYERGNLDCGLYISCTLQPIQR